MAERSLNTSSASYSKWEQEIIALAAVAQAAAVVNKLATRGEATQLDLSACVNPLLVLDPQSFDEVYPNVLELSLGLRTIEAMFSNEREKEDAEVVRYSLSLLHLRSNLLQDTEMQDKIRVTLANIAPFQAIYGAQDDSQAGFIEAQLNTFQQLAALYQDTISTLRYRIQVKGRTDLLKDELIANQIRAVLLAGIRSAVLWGQLGGRRWRLILYRKRICSTAESIRKKLLN